METLPALVAVSVGLEVLLSGAGRRVLTLRPGKDGMVGRRCVRGIGIFPQNDEVVLQVDEHGIRDTAGTPGVAAHSSMPVVIVEVLLLSPIIAPVAPCTGLEGGRVASIPEEDAHRGIAAAVIGALPRYRAMIVCNVRVEAAIPTCLQSHVRIIHGFEVELVKRTGNPDVGCVAVGHFGDGAIDVDVEDVPLWSGQSDVAS